MPSEIPDTTACNQLASDWMHRGMDLASGDSDAALEQAVRCFDEAIALRRTLPLEENHFFRYALSAGWINRGDALARMSEDHSLAEAIKSYDEALVLLETLPLEENMLYPRRLAITWINRGIALQKQETFGAIREAVRCFHEAVNVLEKPSILPVSNGSILLSGAWSNLAGALAGLGEEDADMAKSSANRAIALVKLSERMDAVSAEMGLKARHTLCRLAIKDIAAKKPFAKEAIAEATDAVDEGLDLAAHWKFQGEFAKLGRDIFRFGCRIYENTQPHFLTEFLMESLAPERFGGAVPLDQDSFDAARAAIWSALENLQGDGFQFVASPRFEPVLSGIQELRQVEERLKELGLQAG